MHTPNHLHFSSSSSVWPPSDSIYLKPHRISLSSPHSLICALQSELYFFFFWPLHTAFMRPLFLEQGIEPLCSATGAQSLNHWTSEKVLELCSHHHSKCSYRCCQWTVAPLPALIIPFHIFLSLADKYIYIYILQYSSLPCSLLQNDCSLWACLSLSDCRSLDIPGLNPGFSLSGTPFQRSFEYPTSSLGSEYPLHRHLLSTPLFFYQSCFCSNCISAGAAWE